MLEIKGIGAVDGIAVGAPVIFSGTTVSNEYVPGNVATERERFLESVERTRQQIAAMADIDPVFEFHLEMTGDPELHALVTEAINDGKPATAAIGSARDALVAMFDDIEDEYLRERRTDVEDVCSRMIANLTSGNAENDTDIPSNGILIARTLLPSDMMSLPLDRIGAIVTSDGSPTSHICIIARKHSIPVIVGLGDAIEGIYSSSCVAVDGFTGVVTVDPDDAAVRHLMEEKSRLESVATEECGIDQSSLVDDSGRRIRIEANADSADDVARAISMGAEGIGLFRSEFLFMSCEDFPSEQYQTEYYLASADACRPYPLTVRTLDIGGDKSAPYIKFDTEMNPFMGLRGIRYTLANPSLFRTQLRALLRASVYGNLRVMFPMIASMKEFRSAMALIEECKTELRAEGVKFDENLKVGTMIETPASVIIARQLATECDFFSIGTNDLFQYVMAADRTNQNVAYLLETEDSPVLEAIRSTITAAREAGIECTMCGEMASREKYADLLLDLGLESFSVAIPKLRKVYEAVTLGLGNMAKKGN